MNNGRPAMHASRHFALPDDRDHHKTDGEQRPGPNVRVSPLAQPLGKSNESLLRDCETCHVRAECHESVLQRGPFALLVCEMQISRNPYERTGEYTQRYGKRAENRQRILEAIQHHDVFSISDIARECQLSFHGVCGYMSHLLKNGVIEPAGRGPGRTMYYRLKEQAT